MRLVYECEDKYLINDVNKKTTWDKEQIVYQWYTEVSEKEHTKEKLIFDLMKCRVVYVRIRKLYTGFGQAQKSVEYLEPGTFDIANMINVPFVLKRRSIKKGVFLDRMIRSNGICEYLLEDENNDLSNYVWDEFSVTERVTDRMEYYNQNMCTSFTADDASHLSFLLQSFG